MCCICPGSEEYEYTIGCWKWKTANTSGKKDGHFNLVKFITNFAVL